jgi:endonuclease G
LILDKAIYLISGLLYLLLTITSSYAQDSVTWYLPSIQTNDTIVHHKGFSLLFNRDHKQADWVAYDLSRSKLIKIAERGDKFIADPKVNGTNFTKDYAKSGFDRGHLAPAADMSYNDTCMLESFYFTNMSPQVPSFNRGIWKSLEELIREWALTYDTIQLATGPVLHDGLPTLGTNQLSVPRMYYKVVLLHSTISGKSQGIGFMLQNAGSKLPLRSFACTIDDVEKVTGIDFFPSLEDSLEIELESTLCISCWKWD